MLPSFIMTFINTPADIDAYYPGGRANFTASIEAELRRNVFPNAMSIAVALGPPHGVNQRQRRRMTAAAINPMGPIYLEVKINFGTAAEAVYYTAVLHANGAEATLVEAAALSAPSPPPPPSMPYELNVCENTCKYPQGYRATFNGLCEEPPGGFTYGSGACEFGSDCQDCGSRKVCSVESGCPSTCRERAWRDALADVHAYSRAGLKTEAKLKPFCSENLLGDGVCDPLCNNWECGHDMGDCDLLTEALAKCSEEQKKLKAYFTTHPANHSSLTQQTFGTVNASKAAAVEVRILSFPPISLDIGSDGWSITMNPIQLQLKWRDSRLPTSPCTQVLPLLYTLAQGTERDTTVGRQSIAELTKLIWLPRVEIAGVAVDDFSINMLDALPKRILSSHFEVQAGSQPWSSNSKPTDGSACHDCATLTMEHAVKIPAGPLLGGFDYYPFDRQELVFSLRVPGAHIFNCNLKDFFNDMQMANPESVLPLAGGWNLDGEITVRRGRTLQADGSDTLDDSTCDLVVPVQRNYAMFLIKQVIMSIIVVYVGLASLYMTAADHTGDRAALIGVSALITIVNFQNPLVIGSVPYLVWWDIFNLMAFFVLTLSLVISIIEHRCLATGEDETALTLSMVARPTILCAMYPSMLVYLFIAGLQSDWGSPVALFVLIAGNVLPAMLAVIVFKRAMRKGHKDRTTVVEKLKLATASDPAFHDILEEAFEAFDVDNSGFLDISEARDLLHVLYYDSIGPEQFARAMLDVHKFCDVKGSLNVDGLTDAIVHVAALYTRPAPTPIEPKSLRKRRLVNAQPSYTSTEDTDLGKIEMVSTGT